MSERPFRLLGLQQIAVGGPDKKVLRRLWIDLLGLTLEGEFRSERENVDEDIAVAGAGPHRVEVDLMQPIDPDAKPKVHDPPLNHVGLWVDDLAAAVAWLEGQGMRFTPGGIRKGAAGHDVCFIHPKGNDASPVGGEGVLIELVQLDHRHPPRRHRHPHALRHRARPRLRRLPHPRRRIRLRASGRGARHQRRRDPGEL
jgi:lactoylglutathione lyase